MDKLEVIKRFILVSDTGSFTKAADLIGVPKSAISASISQLEKHLNVRLLHRSTRKLTLTETGERYLDSCKQLIFDFDRLEHQIQSETQTISGVIRVDMPSRFMSTIVLPRLNEWYERYPETQVELSATDFRINPIEESVDFIIRVGELSSSDLIARPLGAVQMVNCVSKHYIQTYGTPTNLESLSNHMMIHYAVGSKAIPCEFEYVEKKTVKVVLMNYKLTVNSTDAYLHGCLNGMGIVQIPKQGVRDYLLKGDLVEILPEYTCAAMPVSILYASRKHMPQRVLYFMDWVCENFKASLSQD